MRNKEVLVTKEKPLAQSNSQFLKDILRIAGASKPGRNVGKTPRGGDPLLPGPWRSLARYIVPVVAERLDAFFR